MENFMRASAPRAAAGDTQGGVEFAVVVHVQVTDLFTNQNVDFSHTQ